MPDTQELSAFMQAEFPQSKTQVVSVAPMSASLCLPVDEGDLRPGGTVSGPTMMALADTAAYVAILGEIGIVPLAVTTSLNINFLRKPAAGKDLLADCHLIKLGKVLAVADVSIYSKGQQAPVAHATVTYSIPPRAR